MNRLPAILIIVSLALLAACENNAPAREGNEYHYYPSKNVYYDVTNQKYFYSLDNGQSWDSLASETDNAAISGDKKVIYSNSAEIWLDNSTHIAEYKGNLLNIINEESLKVPEPIPVTKADTRKNTETTSNEEVKKERKRPVKKFFQKLFGKKKD